MLYQPARVKQIDVVVKVTVSVRKREKLAFPGNTAKTGPNKKYKPLIAPP